MAGLISIGHEPVTTAFRTASGIYAFQGLPGLQDIEYPEKDPALNLQEPLERITVVTSLGIRFWDPVRDTQISDNLIVTARPDPEVASPLNTPRFIIEVHDQLRRFLPTVFQSPPLPYKGIFPNRVVPFTTHNSSRLSRPMLSNQPVSRLTGFWLFSSPTRSVTPGQAAIRGQLVEYGTRRPAAHAVLEVQVKGGNRTWYGVADERGVIAVLLPYPPFRIKLGGSPPGLPLQEQYWELAIRVRYSPTDLTTLHGTKIPDLHSILSQSRGVIWPNHTGSSSVYSSVDEWPEDLKFGQELILRTVGVTESVLLIGAAASPP